MMKKSKICNHCRKIKPASEFYRDRSHKTGLQGRCKFCIKKLDKLKTGPKKRTSKEPHFPYEGNDVLKNKQYLKDRSELFIKHGYGWWWNIDDRSKYPSGKFKPKRK